MGKEKRYWILPCVLGAVLVVAMLVATSIGVIPIPIKVILQSIGQRFGFFGDVQIADYYQVTLWQLRIPRIVMSVLAGAALAICGGVFQSIFRNPVCDPYILGISSGASLGAAIAFILGWDALLFGITLPALVTALLTLFSGTNETEDVTFTINVTPDEALSKQILFRFSSKLGVLPIDNLAGEPVWIDLTDRKMSDNYTMDPDQQKKLQAAKSKKEGTFLYYRLPGRAALRIYNNRTTFLDDEIQLAQFGNVEVISSSIMGKMADAKITFDTTTGAVLTIE